MSVLNLSSTISSFTASSLGRKSTIVCEQAQRAPACSVKFLRRLGLLGSTLAFTSSSLIGSRIETSFALTSSPQSSNRQAQKVMALASPVEVLVKAAVGEPDKLGDCPFSQRVLLTLEEKKIPYEAKYIDSDNKPQWFLDANPEGKVPVLKHKDAWVADSDVITKILEEEVSEPSLQVPEEKASVGSKLFPSFVKFLKSKDATDGTEGTLVSELTALNEHLKENGPFVNGESVSSVDVSLVPKLYHVETALKHYKDWFIPQDLTHVHDYLKAWKSRDSFKKTAAPTEVVIRGWAKHLA
eukprot:jgi/Mesen1/5977/ME000302S04978